MPEVKVFPTYDSINAVRDICEPWIELWGGDEWGESMHWLHRACHTSYGFSDEDCALFASRLIENLLYAREWAEDYGSGLWGYGWDYEDGSKALSEVRSKCRELRDYWLKGGNISSHSDRARETIESMPSWLFEEQDYERLPDE